MALARFSVTRHRKKFPRKSELLIGKKRSWMRRVKIPINVQHAEARS
jgi:hypothetical protein